MIHSFGFVFVRTCYSKAGLDTTVVSVDHSPEFFARTMRDLALHGLQDVVKVAKWSTVHVCVLCVTICLSLFPSKQVVHVPLEPLRIGDPVVQWCTLRGLSTSNLIILLLSLCLSVTCRYNTSALSAVVAALPAAIDLLIVDGPPAQCLTGDCSQDWSR